MTALERWLNIQSGPYPQWRYRYRHRITSPASATGYQHKEVILFKYGMNADFSDIRFTDEMGVICPYYIDSKTDGVTATVWIKVAPALQYHIYLYYGNGSATSESSFAAVFPVSNQFAGSGINSDIENDGAERRPFFEKFDVDDLAQYTVTGAPTISSSVLNLADGDAISRTLPLATAGKWDIVAKFTTTFAGQNQFITLYFGTNSYISISRRTGNTIWIVQTINEAVWISWTNTGTTLADDVYFHASIVYDGTSSQAYYNDVAIGTPIAGTPNTPSIGVDAFRSAVVVNEMNFIPSVAYQDLFGSDTEARYMQLSSTDLSTWASSAAGDVVVSGGGIILSSDDDRGIYATGKVYQYGSGEIEFSFTNGNDGGGSADVCGATFCYQDILNHYKVVIEDDAAGAENLKLYKVIGGTATQIGSTKDVSATYTRGNKTWVKVHYSREYGQVWVYLRDDAGTYPTTPDIADAFVSSWPYGEAGVFATVTTAGAGNLSVQFGNLTIRGALLVGETSVRETESGHYIFDPFTVDSTGRYDIRQNTSTISVAGGVLSVSNAGGGGIYSQTALSGVIILEGDVTFGEITNSNSNAMGVGYPTASAANYFFGSGYIVRLIGAAGGTTGTFAIRRYTLGGTGTTIGTSAIKSISVGTTYHIKFVWDTSTGSIEGYFDNEVSPSAFATDTTYTMGFPATRVTIGTAVSNTTDNFVISGTRVYNKPVLPGAIFGEYSNGTTITAATPGVWIPHADLSAEFTAVGGAATWNTALGEIQFTSANDGIKSAQSFTYQALLVRLSTTSTSNRPAITIMDDGNDGGAFASLVAGTKYIIYFTSTTNIRLSKVVGGTESALLNCTITAIAANTVYFLQIVNYAGAWQIFWNGSLVGTITDTSITAANPTGFGCAGFSSGSVKYHSIVLNGICSAMQNGAGVMNGSVYHGGEWDTGITAGYLLREYADPEPTLELLERQINPAWPQPAYYEANYTIINPDATVTCDAITPTMDRTIANPDATVLCHALAPITLIYPETGLLTAVSAGRGLNDKMNRATFSYDDTAKTDNATTFNRHIYIDLYDHLGVPHRVFFGKAPTGEASFGPAANTEALTAMDYSQNLTMQYLNDAELVLPSLAHQAAAKKYEQHIGLQYLYFQPGMWVHGETSEDSGRIIEVYHGRLILDSMTGGTDYPDPDDGKYYFQDGENLVVGSTTYAIADGHTTDVTGVITLKYPHNHVEMLLGDLGATATNWEFVSGIKPYRLEATSTIWGPGLTVIDADEVFEEMTTKIQAIDRWCKILKFIFLVKTPPVGYTDPRAYFISEANIDDPDAGLDLPDPVTITNPDPYLLPPVRRVYDGLEQCNTVKVKCYGYDTVLTKWRWYYATLQTSAVTSDGEPERVYQEIFEQGASQDECTQRCADLYAYKTLQIQTWYASFVQRVDFEYLQILTFSGYNPDIPDGDYRIIDIKYVKDTPTSTRVNCTLVSTAQFQAYLNLSRTFFDSVNNIQAMIRARESELPKPELVTITEVNTDGTVTVVTDSGITRVDVDGSI